MFLNEFFQAAGGLAQDDRSLLLMNLGGGLFLDVTESVGLEGIVGNTQDTGFGDIDNDGDLDLIISDPTPVPADGRRTGADAQAAAAAVSRRDCEQKLALDGRGPGSRTRVQSRAK